MRNSESQTAKKKSEVSSGSSSSPSSKQILVHASPKIVTLFALLLLLPYALLAVILWSSTAKARNGTAGAMAAVLSNAPSTPAASLAKANGTTNLTKNIPCRPGPWGNVEYTRINIEIPDEYIAARLHETDLPHWFFKGYSREALTQFFNSLNLAGSEKQDLLNSAKWEVDASGIHLRPARETILSISTDVRQKIYTTLAQFEENAAQDQAFSFPSETFDSLFEKSGLTTGTVALVKRLCYPHGRLMMFSDLPTVLSMLPTYDEKFKLEKVISARPTLLATLRITPDSDINELVSYWGRAGYGKDSKPLLESLTKIPDGIRVNLMTLLPPWPTSRLYTYPFPSSRKPEDCHWTSFNFFKDPPEPTSDNGAYWKNKLDTEYYPVLSDPRYGDLVMLAKQSGTIIHSCVFVADDIVYTKNGANYTAPWMLMKIPDLVEAYSAFAPPDEPLKVLYYRNKYY